MTGSQRPVKFNVRKEIAEITKSPTILIAIVVMLIFMCMVPVFFILLPVVIIFLVILYKVGEGNSAKALKIARKHTASVAGTLELEENIDLAGSMVLNDWGIVCVLSGKRPIEIAWSEIESVDETWLGVLEIKAGLKYLNLELGLRRFFTIAEILEQKLPGKCHFLVDLKTGESLVLKRLKEDPKEWKSVKLRVDDAGIEYDGNKMNWDEMELVFEEEVLDRSAMPTVAMSFSNGRRQFALASHNLDGTGLPGYSAYEYVKLIAREKLKSKASLLKPAPTPNKRALDEFMRSQDAFKAAYALVLESGKSHVVEPRFAEMLRLVDKFDLANQECVQQFFHDYAVLLQRMSRDAEAEALSRRIVMPIE